MERGEAGCTATRIVVFSWFGRGVAPDRLVLDSLHQGDDEEISTGLLMLKGKDSTQCHLKTDSISVGAGCTGVFRGLSASNYTNLSEQRNAD